MVYSIIFININCFLHVFAVIQNVNLASLAQ